MVTQYFFYFNCCGVFINSSAIKIKIGAKSDTEEHVKKLAEIKID